MRGGARIGAGRPKGALAKRSARAVRKAEAAGAMPREVMLEAMRYHYDLALKTPLADRGPHLDAAADIAVRAAPYLHPRLAASSVTVRRVSEMTDEELAIATADVRGDRGSQGLRKGWGLWRCTRPGSDGKQTDD